MLCAMCVGREENSVDDQDVGRHEPGQSSGNKNLNFFCCLCTNFRFYLTISLQIAGLGLSSAVERDNLK